MESSVADWTARGHSKCFGGAITAEDMEAGHRSEYRAVEVVVTYVAGETGARKVFHCLDHI